MRRSRLCVDVHGSCCHQWPGRCPWSVMPLKAVVASIGPAAAAAGAWWNEWPATWDHVEIRGPGCLQGPCLCLWSHCSWEPCFWSVLWKTRKLLLLWYGCAVGTQWEGGTWKASVTAHNPSIATFPNSSLDRKVPRTLQKYDRDAEE